MVIKGFLTLVAVWYLWRVVDAWNRRRRRKKMKATNNRNKLVLITGIFLYFRIFVGCCYNRIFKRCVVTSCSDKL